MGEGDKDPPLSFLIFASYYLLQYFQQTPCLPGCLLLVQTMSGKQRCRYAWSDKSKSYTAKDKVPAVYYAQNRGQ